MTERNDAVFAWCRRALRPSRASVALFGVFLAVLAVYRVCGVNRPWLSDYTRFDSRFSWPWAAVRVAFVGLTIAYCCALGKRVCRALGLEARAGVTAALGIVALNVLLMPLFFLHLYYWPVLVGLFLTLSLVLGKETRELFIAVRSARAASWGLVALVVLATPMWVQGCNALVPVSFSESLGDVADAYLRSPMSFAHSHGARFVPRLASTMATFDNWEILASAAVVLTNPDTVKVLGWGVFLVVAWLTWDCARELTGSRWAIVAPLVFLGCRTFAYDRCYSFAQPRNYVLLLSFLALVLTVTAIRRERAPYCFAALIVVGVLAGTTIGGLVAAAICLLVAALFARVWVTRWRATLVALILCGVVASVFPLWNFANTGSPWPVLVGLNRALGLHVEPTIYNDYLMDRVSLQFHHNEGAAGQDYLLFPLRFAREHFRMLSVGLLIGLWYLRERAVRPLYCYVLLVHAVFLLLLPFSVRGEEHARFHWIAIPVGSALIAYTACRVTQWGAGLLTERGMAPARANRVVFWVLAPIVALAVGHATKRALRRPHRLGLGEKIAFVLGAIDLRSYLGSETIAKTEFLNAHFGRQERILYLFREQGIYAKAQLFDPNECGAASAIHLSSDGPEVLEHLRAARITHLCVDNVFGEIANDPFLAMVADIVTPIFEPGFFARHFVPFDDGLNEFYLFAIAYDGVGDASAVADNFRRIDETGFFQLIHESLEAHATDAIELASNPYRARDLLRAYRASSHRMKHRARSDSGPARPGDPRAGQ